MILERLIQRTITVQQIPAPTYHEQQRAEFMLAEFRQAGLKNAAIDSAGNLLGSLSSGKPAAVLICAHMDTVFPLSTDLSYMHSETALHGPGIGDNSVALAALPELAEDLLEEDLPADIWFVGTVGEEGLGNLYGMRQLSADFAHYAAAYLVLEGMALGTIYHRALPIQRYRLTCKTLGGHAWAHHDRFSAIHELIHLAKSILKISLPHIPRTTMNIGIINGGTSINSLANEAFLELDLRSEEADQLDRITRKIKGIVKSAECAELSVELTSIGNRPGGSIPEKHALVELARIAYEHQGISPIHFQIGSTDASIPLSKGIPAVCVGLTYGANAHSDAEFIQLEPLERGYASILELIRSTAHYVSHT
ncbi:MAG: M20/M25/M40 family metallo-hydrolase [Anaerolineales bacterium]|nr:M20/M25/M40 family metallo-hydrolase [Anaerolineales bacterium]